MKDILKNQILYYILVPVVIGFWPILVKAVYLPEVGTKLKAETDQFEKAEGVIEQILKLDPDRLNYADSKKSSVEFDYANAVERAARKCKISEKNYTFSDKPDRTSGGQKTKNAAVSLKEVDITKFAEFLSTIQLRWANLQCEKTTLTKKKEGLDVWKVDLNFKYYY